jgi:hypothetical protein
MFSDFQSCQADKPFSSLLKRRIALAFQTGELRTGFPEQVMG